MADRGTWGRSQTSSASLAPATVATIPAPAGPHASAHSASLECFFSGAESPVSVENPRREPDAQYRAQQDTLRRTAAHSKVLDSRLEIWSLRMGVDAASRRSYLRQGYSVRFTVFDGHHIRQHVVHPKEVR